MTEDVAQTVKNFFDAKAGGETANKVDMLRADFEAAITASDFAWIFEQNPDYDMPERAEDAQKATEGAEVAETVKHTAEATENVTEATEATETAEAAHSVPDTRGIKTDAFCERYRHYMYLLLNDPLFLPRSRPADRQKRKRAIAFYDDTLLHTELVRRFGCAMHDIIDTAKKAVAFTLAYYDCICADNAPGSQGNALRTHCAHYRHIIATERHRTPQGAFSPVQLGILCHTERTGRKQSKTWSVCYPLRFCAVFRSIPGTVGNCRAIVTDTS